MGANYILHKYFNSFITGYYTPVSSLEQVSVSVIQYVNVIARPLVLQGEDHPVSWTHAYADVTVCNRLC